MILRRDANYEECARCSRWDQLQWLTVTFICRRWRTLALGSPLLWNSIYWGPVQGRPPDDWITAFIQRSAEAPLDLDLRISHLGFNIQDLLISHSFRWRNVVFRANPPHLPPLLERLTLPAPHLESFTIIRNDGGASLREGIRDLPNTGILIPKNTFCGHAPNLHVLALSSPIHMHPDSPISRSLKSLNAYWNLRECNLLAVLASAPDLESLHVVRTLADCSAEAEQRAINETAGHFLPADPVQLNRLQHFSVWSRLPRHCTHLLTHLALPALRRLGIAVTHLSQTAPLLDAVISFAQTVQRNDAPVHGIFVSNYIGVTIVGWSLAQIQAMDHSPIVHVGQPFARMACGGNRLLPSVEPLFYFCCSGEKRRDAYVPVLETACRQIPRDPNAVRVLAVVITMERTCAEWHRTFGLWPAIERLEFCEQVASWTLLEAATPNVAERPTFLFPHLKKLVFSGQIKPHGGRALEYLRTLAENRKAAGIPIEVDFSQCAYRSAYVTRVLQQSAKVTWDGEEWMPFCLDNLEQIPDVDGQGVWGNMFDLCV
ncbi:hypothetical protein EWM64_g3494 [Hericium alpestre]|uniref:F-box domain-containing protein n=1 Tax=Hericium alpestre TaxID=135208 RepID=A0A4Z0A4A7_9AGAM|nr:hypothetical protein EWM64_g3494 [Hericium alpestre]